jgi:hypothetical protein
MTSPPYLAQQFDYLGGVRLASERVAKRGAGAQRTQHALLGSATLLEELVQALRGAPHAGAGLHR